MKRKFRTARAYAMALALAATISLTSCRTQDCSVELALSQVQKQYDNRAVVTRSSVSDTSFETVYAAVQRIISEKVDIPLIQVQLNSVIRTDLGIDSLDFVEIIVEVENEFSINIPDDRAEEFTLVEDLVNYIVALTEPQQPVNPNTALFSKVQEIILEQIQVPEGAVINLQANFRTDLGMGSLDCIELIIAVEEEFDIHISGDQADNMKTVEDLVVYIASQTQSQPPVNPPIDPPIVDPDRPVDPPVDPPIVKPSNIEERLKKMLSDVTGTPVIMLTRQTKLKDDLYMDELDIVEFTMAVEAEFGILISEDWVQKLITVGDWLTFIEHRT